MQVHIAEEIKKLSVSERITLVEEIWDSIEFDNEAFELSQAQKDELDKRLESFRQNPNQGRTWDEIKADIFKSK